MSLILRLCFLVDHFMTLLLDRLQLALAEDDRESSEERNCGLSLGIILELPWIE
jgi:hypothetical protein